MPLVTLMLVLFGCLAIATPFIALYLLVKHKKLNDQFEHFRDDSSRLHSTLQREIAELKQHVATTFARPQETPAVPAAKSVVQPASSRPQAAQPIPPAQTVPQTPSIQDVPRAPHKTELPAPVKVPVTEKIPEPRAEKPAPISIPVGPPPVSIAPPVPLAPPREKPAHVPAVPDDEKAMLPAAAKTSSDPIPGLPPAARISSSAPTSAFRVRAPGPTLQQRMKAVSSIEETLGTNWLQKLGIILLVMGVAMFGILELRTLGAAGKVVISFLAAVTLLAGGLFLEKRERYRLLGRTLIGGGWSLLFFSTFSMYHVEAMQGLPQTTANLILDCTLMLGVAMAMALHMSSACRSKRN